ncbi:MAG: PA0069 family radical SAM protein [Alphaproteobacteria bacterium]|jgi:DNA repair photolyase|nr:PA0069 family radical SAM protein [Alphaproteobacteria bacterium]
MADSPIPDRLVKGRGAVSNRSGRFEAYSRETVDDGWGSWDDPDVPPADDTVLAVDRAKTIISRNQSPDVPFEASINPYRGCEHGCVYCFARPTHAWLGLSAGRDFETRLFYKPDAPALLEAELARPGYRVGTLALGANTDPYQPVERRTGLTRAILQVLQACRHPVGVVTKSGLIARDLDILAPMAAEKLAMVCVSVTTLDRTLARRLEPRAPTPARRLETIARLSEAGVPVAILASPMIPGLTDHELERILEAGAAAGAVSANTILLRLPLEIADLFTEWLEAHYPDRAGRVLSLMRQSRGGRLYDSEFGTRMRGDGPFAQLLSQRFAAVCRRLGLGGRHFSCDTRRFRPPNRTGAQLSLF